MVNQCLWQLPRMLQDISNGTPVPVATSKNGTRHLQRCRNVCSVKWFDNIDNDAPMFVAALKKDGGDKTMSMAASDRHKGTTACRATLMKSATPMSK